MFLWYNSATRDDNGVGGGEGKSRNVHLSQLDFTVAYKNRIARNHSDSSTLILGHFYYPRS